MAAPFGDLQFGGLTDFESFTVQLAHGITPSTFTITTVPGKFTPNQGRTLTLRYDATIISFRDCMIVKAEMITGADGKQRLQLTLEDRRWKWRDAPGAISGVYNVRKEDGSNGYLPGTERTPRQLATLLLQAAGERRFNVNKLPNTDRPQVEWEYAEPMAELARLAEQYGCRVVFHLDDSVSLEPQGVGAALPTAKLVSSNDGIDPPERPDSLVLVCGRTEHQLDLELEAVGEDIDGLFKPFNNLSYAQGLPNLFVDIDIPYFSKIGDKKIRALAQKSIYKCYRVKVPFVVPCITPGGGPIVVNELRQILPLLDRQVQLKKAAFGTPPNQIKEEALPPWVYGIWCNAESGYDNVTSTLNPAIQGPDRSQGFIADGFSIDHARGLVWFNDYLFRTIPATQVQGKTMLPAILRLRISINLRDNSLGYFHYEVQRRLPGQQFGTAPLYVKNYQQALRFYTQYNANFSIANIVSNGLECQAFAKLFLDAKQAEYQTLSPQTRVYAGFQYIDLDGAIEQVSWYRGADGFAYTQASRHNEEIVLQPSYDEKRKVEIEQLNPSLQPGLLPPAKVQQAEFSLGSVKQ